MEAFSCRAYFRMAWRACGVHEGLHLIYVVLIVFKDVLFPSVGHGNYDTGEGFSHPLARARSYDQHVLKPPALHQSRIEFFTSLSIASNHPSPSQSVLCQQLKQAIL